MIQYHESWGEVSYLVLDYNRPKETRQLLESIKAFALHPHKTILLVNGGAQDEHYQLYNEGLVDELILTKQNFGGGVGTVDLFKFCRTPFAFYVQSDQILAQPITQENIDQWIFELDTEYSCIDLAGSQCGKSYSERAQFINVQKYLSFAPFELGGPGWIGPEKWTEEHVQEKFVSGGLKIKHEHFFLDNGKISVRTVAGNGVFWHECDTKKLKVITAPQNNQKDFYYRLTDQEWDDIFEGRWPTEGKIPEFWREHSFKVECWH